MLMDMYEKTLKKILDSLVIDDQLQQEIGPLLEVVSPFDAKAAGCFDFNIMIHLIVLVEILTLMKIVKFR